MMIEFVAYIAAQQQTERHASEALPHAPVRPSRESPLRAAPQLQLRRRLSATLHRLADFVEPAPQPSGPAFPVCR
jgi:hypothetical protein